MLIRDKASPHVANCVLEFIEATESNIICLARNPDLNPIEHQWDDPGRAICWLSNPPEYMMASGLRWLNYGMDRIKRRLGWNINRGNADLPEFRRHSLKAETYIRVILEPYTVRYAISFIGEKFVLMRNKIRPHGANQTVFGYIEATEIWARGGLIRY